MATHTHDIGPLALLRSGTALSAFATAGILAATCLSAAPARAQAPPADPTTATAAAEDEEDVIIITGSRIVRPNLDTAIPTVVVGQTQLEATNATNFSEVAPQLPQFAASFGASRTQSTFSGAATSGLQLINLRNAGSERTLVLMNGRRLPGGTTTTTEVDFNTIPSANIERVEVIMGGASAIYGADAVSGVVNIITRSNFNGLEAGASYRIAQRGDDATPRLYVMFGKNIGDGHILLTAEYTKQGEVSCRDRFLCAEDFAWFPPDAPNRGDLARSGVSPFGRFFAGTSSFTRTGEPFTIAQHGFNRNRVRTLAQDTQRYLFAGEARYPVSDALEFFVEGNYALAKTQAAFEGHPFQSSQPGSLFGGGPGVAGLQASIPIDNPFVPSWLRTAVLAATPAATSITWFDRFQTLGGRGARNERKMFRLAGGVRGEFDLGLAGPWRYEASYVYGRTKLDSITRGLVSTANLYHGLRVEPAPGGGFRCIDAAARAAGCVPINPFDGYDAAEAAALVVDAGQHGKSVLKDLQAYVSGDVFKLPGGNLAVAFGVEHRSFSGFLDYDDVINNALVTGNQIGDTEKIKTTVKEAFIEARAPIFGGKPWLQEFALEGAFRISDPNRGSNYKTWRYGGNAEFFRGFRARAMKARSVRAPVPDELSGIGQDFGVVTDPCIDEPGSLRREDPTVAANCLAAGVPVGYNPPLQVRQGTGGFVGGNPDLEPERATTFSYGIAFAPVRDGPLGFLSPLAISVDRFKIRMSGLISEVGRQTKADRCYQFGQFCEDVERGPHPLVAGPFALVAVNDQFINVAEL